MPEKRRVLIVRHGETDGNAEKRLQVPETPLNSNGEFQARLVGKRIANDFKVSKILTSDYLRTKTTAEHIHEAHAVGSKPLLVEVPLLRERNFGDLRGKSYKWAAENTRLFSKNIDYEPPNGESWQSFHSRVDECFEEILEHVKEIGEDEHLVLVSHGLVITSLVNRIVLKGDSKSYAQYENTSVTELSVDLHTGEAEVVVRNCAAHLEFANNMPFKDAYVAEFSRATTVTRSFETLSNANDYVCKRVFVKNAEYARFAVDRFRQIRKELVVVGEFVGNYELLLSQMKVLVVLRDVVDDVSALLEVANALRPRDSSWLAALQHELGIKNPIHHELFDDLKIDDFTDFRRKLFRDADEHLMKLVEFKLLKRLRTEWIERWNACVRDHKR